MTASPSKSANASPATAPRLYAIEMNNLLDLELPTPEPLFPPWIRRGDQVLVYGPTGCGKTMLGLSISLALRYGMPLLGCTPAEPAQGLYLDGEMLATDLASRLRALVQPFERTVDHPWKPLNIVTRDLQQSGVPTIDTIEGRDAILETVERFAGVSFVVLDHLSAWSNPEDDNSAASWTITQDLLIALRRRRVATVIMHHSGKGGGQRGTSRRTDVLDLVLKLSPSGDGQTDGRLRVLIEIEKARHLTSAQREPLLATLEPDQAGGLVWSTNAAPIDKGEKIRELLELGMSASDVAKEVETPRSYVYRVLQEMEARGHDRGHFAKLGKTWKKPKRARSVSPDSPPLRGGKGTGGASPEGTRQGTNRGQ